jgi:hypothetical protein
MYVGSGWYVKIIASFGVLIPVFRKLHILTLMPAVRGKDCFAETAIEGPLLAIKQELHIYDPGINSASKRKDYQESFWG